MNAARNQTSALITPAATASADQPAESSQPCSAGTLPFAEMLDALRLDGVFSQNEIARAIGISKSRMSDLVLGKRKPHVRTVNLICKYMGRTLPDERRAEWHRAGARAHGWEV